MKTAYFWLTPQGKQLAEQLQAHFGGTVESKADFAEAVRRAFADCDALVFVMATGIVVRTIAPLVQSKASDPAVLVLDQRGKHVISLLSGHLGGANAMAEQAAAYLEAAEKPDFDPLRRDIVHLRELPFEERQRLAAENPAYGNIVCRCEGISEGEIVDAIRRTPGARSLDGVKRRVRAGMGRCQGGFCTPRVMEILSRELGVPQTELTKNGGASRLLAGRTKEEA